MDCVGVSSGFEPRPRQQLLCREQVHHSRFLVDTLCLWSRVLLNVGRRLISDAIVLYCYEVDCAVVDDGVLSLTFIPMFEVQLLFIV